jgi:hypothetical protein
LLAVACGGAAAGVIPERDRDELIDRVLKNFWGRAKVAQDRYAQPSSEAERNTVPVSKPLAYRAIDAGEMSGLGEWCGADWQPHFLALARAARAKGLNEKQVAFVSVLHGASQGYVVSSLRSGRACSDAERAKVERSLRESLRQGLEAAPRPE